MKRTATTPSHAGRVGGALFALLAGCAVAPVPAHAADGLDVAIGKAVFDRMWVPAPASTTNADGLGPLFAARSCASCHARGGRTRFRLGRDDPAAHPGLVMRFGSADGAADPVYGVELQPEGAGAAAGEGRATAVLEPGVKPAWTLAGPAYGRLAPETLMSGRVAPSLEGLGLLAKASEAAILSGEDVDDRDRDGVSGRARWIATPQGRALGRFGWKAAEPTLETQTGAAFALDLGLSTAVRPDAAGDCTSAQGDCRTAPQGATGGGVEVAPQMFDSLVRFLDRMPAPPSAEGSSRGKNLFARTGCAACHTPALPVSGDREAAAYTDLLLHDMGPGLDDGVGEPGVASAEWRTAPLWGLSRALTQGSGLLHDGRAKNVADAVRWHDGEAERARKRFDALSVNDRSALIGFVNGL